MSAHTKGPWTAIDRLMTALHAEHTEGLPQPYRDLVIEIEAGESIIAQAPAMEALLRQATKHATIDAAWVSEALDILKELEP